MSKEEKSKYRDTDELREMIAMLKGMKFRLDCGHHVTFGHSLGSNVTIYNGKSSKIICTLCSY